MKYNMGGDTVPVKFVPVEINENRLEQGATEILKEIRPKWNSDDIQFKLLTDGITNKLVKCHLTDNPQDVVLVRVYGQKTDMLIDRKAETRNIILLHEENLAPQLYATFKNGLAYEYVPGVTLNPKTAYDLNVAKLVAVNMAKLHKLRPNNVDQNPATFSKIEQFYNLIPEKFSDNNKHKKYENMHYVYPKMKIVEEVNSLKDKLLKLNSPLVFAHNDLLLGNVIYNTDNTSVTFIDYEYAAMNYQAFDISNHFAEFQGNDVTSPSLDYYPSEEFQFAWIKSYLQEYNNTDNVSDEEINQLYYQVNDFVLASHLLWGLWGLVQAEHSTIDFDYMQFAKVRLEQYFAIKERSSSQNRT